jgi:hypothetical protein
MTRSAASRSKASSLNSYGAIRVIIGSGAKAILSKFPPSAAIRPPLLRLPCPCARAEPRHAEPRHQNVPANAERSPRLTGPTSVQLDPLLRKRRPKAMVHFRATLRPTTAWPLCLSAWQGENRRGESTGLTIGGITP